MPVRFRDLIAALFGLALFVADAAPLPGAETAMQVIVHAGKADSSYHALAVQFAEAVAKGDDALVPVVEESQGSVQNIIDAPQHPTNYVFTAPPSLIAQARRGEKPFSRNQRYGEIRALFPIPPLTMHWLVRADGDVRRFTDLAGRPFVPGGKGSFGERQTASALHALGLERTVPLIDIDANAARGALLGRQVAGLAVAGNFPVPAVSELARAVPLRLLSLGAEELKKVLAADDSALPQVIPAGTYPGIDEDVVTVALPAGVYTTTRMSEATAYAITKAFWTQKPELGQRNPPWNAVTPGTLAALGVTLHKGALRYYREAGIKIPTTLR